MSALKDQILLETVRELADQVLRPRALEVDLTRQYPAEQTRLLADLKLNGMCISPEYGGLGLSAGMQARILLELAAACATTAFILSQRQICSCLMSLTESETIRQRWLPELAAGTVRAADAVNYLRWPVERAPVRAFACDGGFRVSGSTPWLTAAHHTDILVAGAILEDRRQMVAIIPVDERIQISEPLPLMAFEGSDTCRVGFNDCIVPIEDRVHGPSEDVLYDAWVLKSPSSEQRIIMAYLPVALALGHMRTTLESARDRMITKGPNGRVLYMRTHKDVETLTNQVLTAIDNRDASRAVELRIRANQLVGSVAHLALLVTGGSGYQRESNTQRFYREAAFWSVWSIGSIVDVTLNEMAAAEV